MRQVFVPILAIIIFLLFWEALVWVNGWPNYKMASPSDLWPAFWRFKGLFLSYGWETLWRTVVGLLIAIGVSQFQVGLEFDGAPLAGSNDENWPISIDGQKVGYVTSAVHSPRLEKNIALAVLGIALYYVVVILEKMFAGWAERAPD